MAEYPVDIEQLLKEGKTIQITPRGYSMYPMLAHDRDEVVIAPLTGRLRRGDVVLYRRRNSILVLHRIWKVKPEGIYLVGDNQTEIEGPLEVEQVRGILVEFIRKGKRIPVSHPLYRILSRSWLFMRPIRHRLAVAVHWLKVRGSKK